VSLGLSPVELRILGSLIEKERATPQGYPLTGNSLRLACNQSSNRNPVVDYDDRLIETTVAGLKEQGLLRFVYSQSNRAAKYRHVLDEALHLDEAELAVLGVLFLRGPQTLGEIKGRTERLHRFADLGEVEATLDALAAREPDPLVRRLERRPGQKDSRYVHLVGIGDPVTEPAPEVEPVASPASPYAPAAAPSMLAPATTDPAAVRRGDDPRVDELVAFTAQLRTELDELRAQLDELRHQLGD
jgi:uncharacterized protein YceH (UPF0502 family)